MHKSGISSPHQTKKNKNPTISQWRKGTIRQSKTLQI